MAQFLLVVTSSALDGRDQAFNDWYDNVHLQDMLDLPGVTSGRRYDALPQSPAPTPAKHLAIFELEAEDPLAVLGELGRRMEAGEISGTTDIDPSSVQMWIYKPH